MLLDRVKGGRINAKLKAINGQALPFDFPAHPQ